MLELGLSMIATAASVISAICALRAKAEVKKLENQLIGQGNIQLSGGVHLENTGDNQGAMVGVNSGNFQH